MLALVAVFISLPWAVSAQIVEVTVTSPAAGASVRGTITATASVGGLGGLTVVGVQFKLDGANLGAEDTSAPYSIPWNTTQSTNGSHVITAVARNLLGSQYPSGPVTVTVDNVPPTVTVNQATAQTDPTNTSPINFTAVFSESITGFNAADVVVSGTAGGNKTVGVTGGPRTFNIAVSGMTDGTVIASVAAGAAQDAAGNSSLASTSTDKTVTFDITPPAPPSTPDLAAASDSGVSNADNITSSSAPTFTGTAEAGSTVKIYSDGVQVGTSVAASGSYTIVASSLSNGPHSITAKATDSLNNVSSASAALNVTIDTASPTVAVTAPAPGATVSGIVSVISRRLGWDRSRGCSVHSSTQSTSARKTRLPLMRPRGIRRPWPTAPTR